LFSTLSFSQYAPAPSPMTRTPPAARTATPHPMATFAPVLIAMEAPPSFVFPGPRRGGGETPVGTGYDGRSYPSGKGRKGRRLRVEPTWHDGLSRTALVELVEGLLLAMDKAVPRLDAIAHHLSLISQQGEEFEIVGGVSDQVADIGDELYSASDRDKLREWGNEIDTPEKAH